MESKRKAKCGNRRCPSDRMEHVRKLRLYYKSVTLNSLHGSRSFVGFGLEVLQVAPIRVNSEIRMQVIRSALDYLGKCNYFASNNREGRAETHLRSQIL